MTQQTENHLQEEVAEASAADEQSPEVTEAEQQEATTSKEEPTTLSEAREAMDELSDEPLDDRAWFVIHTYSGYESRVRSNLDSRIQSMDMAHKIFRVVVPTEDEIEVRDGQRRTVARKVFPGYVLVQMKMDDDSWYVVRNTPGVTGFVGSGTRPIPLRQEEVRTILKQMVAEEPKIKIGFDIGQSVRVVDGPFSDFVGTVDDLFPEKGKVRVLVSFFGRETPVELDFLQVEKI